MTSIFVRRSLSARPLRRVLTPRVLARFASQASYDKSIGSKELRNALENLFKDDQPHQKEKPEYPLPREESLGGMEELFHSPPPPEVLELEPPIYTLSAPEVEAYRSNLPQHLTEDVYSEFKKTDEHKHIVSTMKARGATEDDVEAFEYFILDPEMNGGYVNPARAKRSERDPYGDWWDKQERRNYGEPVHEDNDMLGIFSFEDYNVFTSKGAFQGWAIFISGVAALTGLVYLTYPDKPAVPRTTPGGLLEEYGGIGADPPPSDEE